MPTKDGVVEDYITGMPTAQTHDIRVHWLILEYPMVETEVADPLCIGRSKESSNKCGYNPNEYSGCYDKWDFEGASMCFRVNGSKMAIRVL